MAKATPRRQLSGAPLALLGRALDRRQRGALEGHLRGLLGWQEHLDAWPRSPRGAPDATPFVALYARGRLVGCVGCVEGPRGTRVGRAFLHALHDPRHGGLAQDERATLSAELSYVSSVRSLPASDRARCLAAIEVGTHGLLWVAAGGERSAILLPQVARDHAWGPDALLRALRDKAAVDDAELARGTLYRLSAESVVVHAGAAPPSGEDGATRAAQWLADRIGADGSIEFAVDARSWSHRASSSGRITDGLMAHGRGAVVLEALRAWPAHRRRRERAARALVAQIDAGLQGRSPPGWPESEDQIAGTLALAVRAGLPFRDRLVELARSPRLPASPWHAAQVVAALGRDAPEALWAACVHDLGRHSWAPWTALGAMARDDRASFARAAPGLIDALAARAVHAGGVMGEGVPELARTAVTVEALAAGPRSSASTAAIVRGRAFLARWQLLAPRIPAALDPARALGAFPLTPVFLSLRSDVTAHALLAMG